MKIYYKFSKRVPGRISWSLGTAVNYSWPERRKRWTTLTEEKANRFTLMGASSYEIQLLHLRKLLLLTLTFFLAG
jgi:hypothetical protein